MAREGKATDVGGTGAGRLRTPAVSCPACGARPALRVAERLVALVEAEPGGSRVASYQCQRRRCGTIYDIPVAALWRAR